jgi:hypothetical protein
MFKSLSVPKNRCAFDILLVVETVGDAGDLAEYCVCLSMSLLGLWDLRPGIGKENLGMVRDRYCADVVEDSSVSSQRAHCRSKGLCLCEKGCRQ